MAGQRYQDSLRPSVMRVTANIGVRKKEEHDEIQLNGTRD